MYCSFYFNVITHTTFSAVFVTFTVHISTLLLLELTDDNFVHSQWADVIELSI